MSGMGENYEDPAVEELLMQLMQNGYQPFGAQMSVPYTQDVMGGNTDPTRQWKSQDTILKSQRSLMGFDPIQGFAGPEPELWIPGTEQLTEEIAGDEIGEQLMQALDSGAGVITLQREIADRTYDPETEDPTEGRELSPQQAEVYRDWLSRYSKARAEDYVKLGQPGATTDPAELDPMGEVPSEEALNFNEDDYIKQLTQGGAFGDRNRSTMPSQRSNRERDPGFVGPRRGPADNVRSAVRGLTSPGAARSNTSYRQQSSRPMGEVQQAMNRGYSQLEQKYRDDGRQAQASSTRPSMAKERAYRAIVAYRLAHGMNPT